MHFIQLHYTSVLMSITVAAGLVVFINWAIKSRFGRRSLESVRFRANSMPYYVPFAVILGWLGINFTVVNLARDLSARIPNWHQEFITFSLFIAVEIVIVVFILAAVKKYFNGGLRGFGLRTEAVGGDITSAAAIFFAVWPLVFGALYLTIIIGKLVAGPDFQIEQNEGFKVIIENDQFLMRFLTIFFATILTPVFEELVFRGLLQSLLRNLGFGPWRSIFACSVVFALLHPLTHFPGILILAIAMGYAYEKSGSLWRSIFLHCIFNSTQIALALLAL